MGRDISEVTMISQNDVMSFARQNGNMHYYEVNLKDESAIENLMNDIIQQALKNKLTSQSNLTESESQSFPLMKSNH